jgi:hypothetical protein
LFHVPETKRRKLVSALRCVLASCVSLLTDQQRSLDETDAMKTEDNHRPATLNFTCAHCLSRAARALQLEGLNFNAIAAALGLSRPSVELLLWDGEI